MLLRNTSTGGTRFVKITKRPYYTAFNPNSIAGLQVWLDGMDILGTGAQPMTGSTVTTWYDKSGNGKHAASTGIPIYNTTAMNSLPAVVFTGSQSFLGSVTNSGSTLSAFVVATITTSLPRTGDLYIMTLGASGISGFSNAAYYGVAKIPTTTTTIGSFRNGALSSYSGITANSAFIASSVVSGSNSILYISGTPGSTVSTSGNFTISHYALGSDTLTSAGIFIGAISEVLLYSTALTVTEQQTIESYLAQKWAVTASLPANHLHSSRPAGMPATTRAPLSILSLLSSGFMSTVYNLSSYSLVNIASPGVSSLSSSNAYIWTVSVPSNAKGKNGILAIFFNLYSSTQFSTNQYFDYGIYLDDVSLMLGDSTGTLHYVHTAGTNYAMSSGGISLGLNGLVNGFPLILPVSFLASASVIQIGIKNSSSAMSPILSSTPGYTSNIVTETIGAGSNTLSYIPKNTFSTTGTSSYIVPTTCSMGTVTGVYLYLWGCGGGANNTNAGGPGGYTSGYYSCVGGTTLTVVVGGLGGGSTSTGGGTTGGTSSGGGFSGIFTSGGVLQANAIAIAGGGGGACSSTSGGSGNGASSGGAGGGSNGNGAYYYGYTYATGSSTYGGSGGSQTAAGSSLEGRVGSALLGGGSAGDSGGAGGGYWGGGGGGGGSSGGGGSGYIGGLTSSGYTVAGNQTTTTIISGAGSNVKAGGPYSASNGLYTASNSPYFPAGSNYGSGNGSTGLVVIVPAIGTNPVQIGVSATLYSG